MYPGAVPKPPAPRELPVAGGTGWERQRTAAARNHEAILQAARELFEADGIGAVDVRQIAAAAGVGVGTVYRRFGDKAGVMAALLGDQERALQDAVLAGPAPLGPGAEAPARLEAFLRELSALTERNLDLLHALAAAIDHPRRQGGYGSWHLHVTVLLSQIAPGIDAEWYADVLLAPLNAAFYRHHRREQGMAPEAIADKVVDTARRVTHRPPSPAPAAG